MNYIPLIITLSVTMLSGGTAAALTARRRSGPVATMLARIAFLGAATMFALLGTPD